MSQSYFAAIPPIPFEGAESENPLAYRYYNKDRVVLGKRMEDHLRMAVCYWHTFCAEGADMFGPGTFHRPWNAGPMDQARAEHKLNEAFEFFTRLGLPYFCFHDTDVMAEAHTIREHVDNLARIGDRIQEKMAATGVKLLWGTANLFSHPRYMAGAASSPGSGCVPFRGHAGAALHRTDQAAGRRELRPVGRARRLRLPAEYGSQAGEGAAWPLPEDGGGAQAQDRLYGNHSGRAEAARTHQAPVRPRRRNGLCFSSRERAGKGSEAEYRGEPRHAGRPQL